MASKRYTFVLNFGYVESASISYMPWVSSAKYKDAKEALLDLAAFLKNAYLLKFGKKKKCCSMTQLKDPNAKFCSKCGQEIAIQGMDGERFSEWLYEMGGQNFDSFHADYVDYDGNDRWQTGLMEGSPNHRYVYQAEWVLAAAAGYPHNGTTFEDICKERTKKKEECFSCS